MNPDLPTITRMWRPVAVSALALALAACASSRGLAPEGRLLDAADVHSEKTLSGVALSPAGWPSSEWWRALGDPQLDALVAEGLQGSPSLASAEARLRQAQAQAGARDAERKPSLSVSGGYTGLQLPESMVGSELGGSYAGSGQVVFDFSYGFDLWGGKRAAWEAAVDQAHAAQVDAQAARLELSAGIAEAYAQFGQAWQMLDVANSELERSQKALELTRQRRSAGIDSDLQLRQAEARVPAAQQQVQAAQQQIDEARNALAALVGKGPDRGLSIERPRLSPLALQLPSVLPADLLGRRPDVVAARWRVEAAAQGISSAKAQFRPSVDLSGLVGLAATGFSDLFAGDAALGFGGPAISLPVFDAGARRNRLDARNADYDLAVASYNQGVVDALHEVTDAVQAIRSLDAQERSLAEAHEAASAALQLAQARYEAGVGTQLDVLSAQRPLLQIEQQQAALRAQRYQATVQLDRALGGGLDLDAPASASATAPESNS